MKKQNVNTAIAFAVALYCLLMIGFLSTNVTTIKNDIRDIKNTMESGVKLKS